MVTKFPVTIKKLCDQENRFSNQWSDETKTDILQLDKYDTFKELGKVFLEPLVHNKIRSHLMYEDKFDGCHKARLVDDVHLTDIIVKIVYSGVVSLCGIRIILYLFDIN